MKYYLNIFWVPEKKDTLHNISPGSQTLQASLVQAASEGKPNIQKNPQKESTERPGDKCQGTD